VSAPIDQRIGVATPEGIELVLEPAGPVPRALAWLVDFLWRFGVLVVLAFPLMVIGEFGQGLWFLAWFLLEWLAPAAFEAFNDGATPGKRALGLRVVRDDGAPLTWRPALTRNLLRFADFLPMLYLGGLLSMLIQREHKRLGDLVAGTLVVHVDTRPPGRRIPAADPLPPPRPLTLAEARTVLDYAERAPLLGAARAAELADLAAPLLRPDSGPAPEQLIRIANHLAGTHAHAPG
jgi:uncharacterized RDD family membrane protein YckC